MVRTNTASKHRLGPVVIVVLALMMLLLVPAMAQAATMGTVTWQGRGPNPAGEMVEYHFVLTPGGNTVLQSGSIDVTFTGGGSESVSGAVKGGTRGAMHFYVTGTGPVLSAMATVTYTGSLARSVLTISDATVRSTTTTVGGTTSTTQRKGTTTTVQSKGTTTTVGGVTSTTAAGGTTTTVGGTGTTVKGVTSTTGVSGGTTTTGSTSTAVLGVSTSGSTTSTVQTPTRIETGGGGTAGGNDRGLFAAVITAVLAGLSLVAGKLTWAKLH